MKLSKAKINALFNNAIKYDGAQNSLSRKLNIRPETFIEYMKQGRVILEENYESLAPILEFDFEYVEDQFDMQKDEVKDEFLAKTEDGGISDRNRNAFDVYFYKARERYKEKVVYELQKNIVDNMKNLSDDDKLLLHLVLIFDRAKMSILELDLYLKDKYSKASSKHLSVVVKDIERLAPDDFRPVEEKQEKQVQQIGTINNIFQLVQTLDEAKKMGQELIPDDIIDAEFENKKDG